MSKELRNWIKVLLCIGFIFGLGIILFFQSLGSPPVQWTESRVPVQPGQLGKSLAVRTLGANGNTILFLHGLVGSQRFWGQEFESLARTHRMVVPDLLGFGQSPLSGSGYGVEKQVNALIETLNRQQVELPLVVVGHSAGCVVALGLAALHPSSVSSVVCFSPALYENSEQARRRISELGLITRFFALDTQLSRSVCEWMSLHVSLAAAIAEYLNPELPAPIAHDAALHSAESYFGTMNEVIFSARGNEFLGKIQVPVRLIAGTKDHAMELAYLEKLAKLHSNVTLTVWPGLDHQVPLEAAQQSVDEIEQMSRSK